MGMSIIYKRGITLSLTNLGHLSPNQNNISNTNSLPKFSFLCQTVQKLEKCQKITKGHNFVNKMKTKNSKSNAHHQIKMKHSAKFQVNFIKDVAGVAGTRYETQRAITLSKRAETKQKTKKKQKTKQKKNGIKLMAG